MKTPSLENVEVWGLLGLGAVVVYLVYEAWSKTSAALSSPGTRSFVNELLDDSPPAISDPNKVVDTSPAWKKAGQGGMGNAPAASGYVPGGTSWDVPSRGVDAQPPTTSQVIGTGQQGANFTGSQQP